MSLIYVRHGETKLNKDSGERLRGWLPVDLNNNGVQQSKDAASKLASIKPSSFSTSDLQRAIQTAAPIGAAMGMNATPKFELRDWNTGELAGQEVDKVLPQLHHYIDHPDEPIPGGEALNDYASRFVPYIKPLVESQDLHVVVGHARGSQVLHSLANRNGEDFDRLPLKEKPALDPGQMLFISPDWSTLPALK